MIRTSLFVIIATFIIALLIFQHPKEKRVALVLSSTWFDHQSTRKAFDTPTPDVALTLSRLGFKVIESIEPTREVVIARMREFNEALKDADVGLIYYSGKIGQFSGRNYIIPSDMEGLASRSLELGGVAIDPLIYEMGKRVRHSFVFLSACRMATGFDPFNGKVKKSRKEACRGLDPIGAGKNILIAHANQPSGNDSYHHQNEAVFVNSLTRNLLEEDKPVNLVLSDIRQEVIKATRSRQVIWTENEKGKDFVFRSRQVAYKSRDKSHPKMASLIPLPLAGPKEGAAATGSLAGDKAVIGSITEGEKPLLQKVSYPTPQEFLEEQRKLNAGKKQEVRMDRKTAIRVLQKKLYEFSCYRGRIDGVWGKKSRRAVAAFKRRTKVRLSSRNPGVDLYKAISEYSGPVCGRRCKGTFNRARNGKCQVVAKQELPFIPVIINMGAPKSIALKTRVKKAVLKKKKVVKRKFKARKRKYAAYKKKKSYKKKAYVKRKYRKKKKAKRKVYRKKRQKVAYYKSRKKKSRGLWSNLSD